ncbi:hypothetical protein NPIL_512111 [Nephila pilipes]|uniref:Uncharacterized protein n=1 Tax=Nephila pilipes TaxID=299642 RepID=A0A8X6QLE3_NEPPI|nr:hypothetical protein NPIL_512111 [Nephila pilipes]
MDTIEGSLFETQHNTYFYEKEVFKFSNADFEIDEPELTEIFKNPIWENDPFSDLFNEKFHFFPITMDESPLTAVRGFETIEMSKVSSAEISLENHLKKSSKRESVTANPDSLAASPRYSNTIENFSNDANENSFDSNQKKEPRIFGKVKEYFKKIKMIKNSETSYKKLQ